MSQMSVLIWMKKGHFPFWIPSPWFYHSVLHLELHSPESHRCMLGNEWRKKSMIVWVGWAFLLFFSVGDQLFLYWNRPPYIFVVVGCFYIALFSALEQTHCARMWFCRSESLFYSAFVNIHWSGVLAALACCHLGAFCVHHTTMHHDTSCKTTYVRSLCVFSCNLPPALLADWPGSFTYYCGGTDTEIRVSTESWN